MNILVLLPLTQAHKVQLESAYSGASFVYTQNETREQINAADIIIGNPDPKDLHETTQLKWLHLGSAGSDLYTAPAVFSQPNPILTNSTGAYGLSIAEHMIATLLSLYRNLPQYHHFQQACAWKDAGPVKSIWGCTALVIGLGDIGGEFAKRIKALGGYTIGIRRTGTQKPDYLDELYHTNELEQVLGRADVVALSLPATAQTYHIIDRARLALMKPEAVLLNVGRGNAVDTQALCDALEQGKLRGAALDVTDPEPLPADHRLWKIPNVIITPHVSGGYHLQETFERIVRIAVQQLGAFQKGEELQNVVDFETGYRRLKE